MENDETVPASVAAAGPAFRDAYLMLRRQYGTQLPQKLQEAQDALRSARAAPGDPAPLEQLRRLMHTMAGTAPSIGYDAQGALARRVEQGVAALLAQPERDEAAFAGLEGLLAELQALGSSR